jgi:hypothetical protein
LAVIGPASRHSEQPDRTERAADDRAKLRSAEATGESHAVRGKHAGRVRRPAASHLTSRGARLAARAGGRTPRHLVQAKKEARASIRHDL